MPNWCSNVLQVTGPLRDVRKFIVQNRYKEKTKGPLSFDRSIPMPEHFKNKDAPVRKPGETTEESMRRSHLEWAGKLPASDWHSWRICHWGTKWDAEEADISRIPGGVQYTFLTAWSPPVEWVEETSSKYPTLKFKIDYEEPGCDFAGTHVVQNGHTLETRDTTYHELHPEEMEEEGG